MSLLSLLDWDDLIMTVTRQRAKGEETARGNSVESWTTIPPQPIRCLIQPKSGKQPLENEGLLAKATHVLYCRLESVPDSPRTPNEAELLSTDIQTGDRIVDSRGLRYRVVFVADEGGQGDHYKVYLEFVAPKGD